MVVKTCLEVLLSVEDDRLCLHFSVLDVDFVAGQDNWDVLANSRQISVPVRDVLVSHSRRDVKHDDRALSFKR
jgi:hypothetical protein